MREINIATTISAKRREKGITQDELAEYMGVSKASVSKWETAQSYPDITLLPQLATFFNISIDELIGYLPQLTKQDIRKTYLRLAHDFSIKPFEEVYKECQSIIKKYFSCFPLLVEMAILLINHHMLEKEKEKQEEILKETISLCERVKKGCEDVWISKQANSIEALCYLILQKPVEVLELLDGTIKPALGDEATLSSAYQMKGDMAKAKSVLQVSIYQSLINLLSFASSYIALHLEDKEKVDTILERFISVSQVFDIDKLRPDLTVKIYYVAALAYAAQKNLEKTLEMLTNYAKLCTQSNFVNILHGDEFFDCVEEWFHEFDLTNKSPRDIKVIKESMVQIIRDNPSFTILHDEPRFKNIVYSLEVINKIN